MRHFDKIILNGVIVDGTRFPRFRANVGVRDGLIAEVGALPGATADEVVDAEGLIVAPGHIDLHTHYDAQVFWDPYCSNSGENGVTTVVTGNCGFGFAPCRPEDRDRYMLMMENTEQVPVKQLKVALPWTWESFPEWLETLKALPKGVNLLMFMPINPLMIYVMGIDAAKSRRPTSEELSQMKSLIHEAMDAGACGIGLSFLGSGNSHTDFDGSPMPTDTMHKDDACALASVLGERGEGFIQVLPQLGFTKDFELPELLAKASGRPVVVNVVAPTTLAPDMHLPQLKWLEAMQSKGLQIYGQGFFHRAWSEFNLLELNINDHVPVWRELSCLQTVEEKLKRIGDREYRARMIDSYDPLQLAVGSGPLEAITISSVNGITELESYIGRSLAEIGVEEGKHVLDVLFDISLATNGLADFRTPAPSGDDPDLMASALHHPLVLSGTSDGGAHSKFYIGGHWPTELICWLSRDNQVVGLEELHARMSHDPARVAGIQDRGSLRPGMRADIIIYDLAELKVNDGPYEMRYDLPAEDWRRYRQSFGYRYILVNGEITHRDDRSTGSTPGSFVTVSSVENRPQLRSAAE